MNKNTLKISKPPNKTAAKKAAKAAKRAEIVARQLKLDAEKKILKKEKASLYADACIQRLRRQLRICEINYNDFIKGKMSGCYKNR